MSTQVAFNSGFATTALPTWTDLTPRMLSFSSGYGRQYELDQNQTGTAQLVLLDKDEVLNPANPAPGAPYAGNILPYRPVMVQAQWPPVPVGAAVNLLNASTQSGPIDPSFESYTAPGPAPSWITAVGGITATVTTTTPQQGTKDLTYTVAGGNAVQGVQVTVACIPGQQYTASAYVRQTSASATVISVVGGASGTSTVATGAYVRLAVTFTATQPTHDIQIAACGPLNTNPYFETSAAPWTAKGGTVARSTAQFHQGAASLLLTPDGVTATAEADSEAVPAAPSSPLRARAWVLCAVARNVFINVNWFASGGGYLSTSTSPVVALTANTWTQLDYTPTAPGTAASASLIVSMTGTPPTSHLLWIDEAMLTGTAVAGTVNLDAIQHEPSASASAFTTTGPVIYGVHRGYVERWPASWKYNGMYGYCQVTSVDAFAALAARKLHAAYRTAVLATQPDYYWPLSEPAGATLFADGSGRQGNPSLGLSVSAYGTGTAPKPAQAVGMPGDPGGVGVKFTPDAAPLSYNQQKGTILGAGPLATTNSTKGPLVLPATIGSAWSLTVAAWVVSTQTTTNDVFMAMTVVSPSAFSFCMPISISNAGLVHYENINGNYLDTPPPVRNTRDGLPHLIVGVVTQDNTNTTVSSYIDGVLDTTATSANTSLAGMLAAPGKSVLVGGSNTGSGFFALDGLVDHVALWSRVLTSTEVAALWTAGTGYPGETSGARITRYLNAAAYSGATAIDTGQSTMGVDVTAEGTNLLAAAQADALSENGNLWVDGTGAMTFTSRTRRYLSTTSKYSFGEQELPYENGIAYDYDMQLVYNDVTIQNASGVNPNAFDAPSQSSYGPRSYSRSVNVQSDNEAIDAASWILATHKDPRQRIAQLTIKPSANPALWPVALGAKVGDRVTVKRRTAAFTMSSDYFVEHIAHNESPDVWRVTLELSPAALWPTPWILDDPTYSVLGSTSILGY